MSSIRLPGKLLGVFMIVTMGAGCAAGGGGETAATSQAPTPEVIEQGRLVFAGAGNCQACHGAGGVGGRFGPDLADGNWIWFDADSPTLWDEVAAVVRDGIPEPREFQAPMPARGGGNLSEDQVMAVAAYVISLN